jgi:hypothetical protein
LRRIKKKTDFIPTKRQYCMFDCSVFEKNQNRHNEEHINKQITPTYLFCFRIGENIYQSYKELSLDYPDTMDY